MADTSPLPDGVIATGIGSWPGTDVREALAVIRGELGSGATPAGVTPLPYLPELPARGPGADLVGRTAHLLVDLPVDLQPQGWRVVDRPGRDAERAAAWWRQDLDELAEAFDGYTGPFKVQVTGPWTLAASLWTPLRDRVLADPGATRDLIASLTEGVAAHLAQVRALAPGATLVLQVDEPSLSAVALGRIRSDSGYRSLRTPDRGELVSATTAVLGQALAGVAGVHSCAGDLPLELLRESAADFLALDVSLLDTGRWEQVAEAVESGTSLWAGLPDEAWQAGAAGTSPPTGHEELERRWRQLGLPLASLTRTGVTPTCGLADRTPEEARAATTAVVTTAGRLADAASG